MVGPTLSLFSHLDTKPQLTLEIKRREIFKCQVTVIWRGSIEQTENHGQKVRPGSQTHIILFDCWEGNFPQMQSIILPIKLSQCRDRLLCDL